MAQEYIYNGQTYTLDDGLSNDQARGIIENYLSTQSKEEEEKKKPEETVSPTYEGGLQEFGEGVVSGLIAIPQGIAELGASLIDLAADTPERHIKPKRTLIVLLSVIIGGFLGIVFVLIRNAVRNRKSHS